MQNLRASTPQLTPATSLDTVYQTLTPDPLTTKAELNAFYRSEINEVRGGDKMVRMQLGLERAYTNSSYFKAFFMGHRGCGKSTELSRLIDRVQGKFCPIRFSAMSTLNPSNFRPLDVVLMMMADVAEYTSRPIEDGGAGEPPPEARLREIWEWFGTEKSTIEQARASAITIEAGAGMKSDSLWGLVTGLFATLKGEMKFSSNRKQETIEHRVSRLDTLIEVANRLMDDCNDLLRKKAGKEWLFIGEDFDRAGIPTALLEDLFVTYANIFRELRTHLIFSLPINLFYSSKATQLPFSTDRSFILADTPVFQADKTANQKGRAAIVSVLTARMDLDLFAAGQMNRAIVASGGNLSDLFSIINYAADTAIIRGGSQIEAEDLTQAIYNLRSDYERRLGQSPYDPDPVTYPQKADRLMEIYNDDPKAQITDSVMYSLLNARAIQEFNGKRWFCVHPLVVDILVKQQRIQPPAGGLVPGGLE
jgi:hypothetical protein